MKRLLLAASAIAALALASCAASTPSPSMPPVTKPAAATVGKLSFTIFVPAGVSPAAGLRRPAYVSSATRSVSFEIGNGSVQIVPLTPGSANCPSGSGGYTCTANADVPAGSTQLTVATYASTDGSGATLSTNTLAIVIVADTNNPITVTLNGVAAALSLAVNPSSINEGTPSSISVTWSALDASGNTIVGPGSVINASGTIVSPSLAVSDTANFTVGAVSGNMWSVSYDGAVTTSPVTFTVSNVGVPSGNATATVTPLGQRLFVANYGANDSVSVYDAPYTGTPTVITNGIGTGQTPFYIAVSASYDVFVPNTYLNNVTMYAPPYTGAPAVTIPVTAPRSVALDASGNLFVSTSSAIEEFAPPYTGMPAATITSGLNNPVALAVDDLDDVFVENEGNFTVGVFVPPYTGTPTEISSGCPPLPCLEPVSGLAAIPGTSEIVFPNDGYATTGYTAPYLGTSPAIDIANGSNSGSSGIAIDASGDLFIAYYVTNSVAEFKPPYSGTAAVTITNGIKFPRGLSLDSLGDLFVANYNNTVTEYAPPYTGAPTTTISTLTTGGSYPYSTALSPASAL